jgi:hypothetical protein
VVSSLRTSTTGIKAGRDGKATLVTGGIRIETKLRNGGSSSSRIMVMRAWFLQANMLIRNSLNMVTDGTKTGTTMITSMMSTSGKREVLVMVKLFLIFKER